MFIKPPILNFDTFIVSKRNLKEMIKTVSGYQRTSWVMTPKDHHLKIKRLKKMSIINLKK